MMTPQDRLAKLAEFPHGIAEDMTVVQRFVREEIWHIREEERRLIARELHDKTAQNLCGIGLLLAKERRRRRSSPHTAELEEASKLIAEVLSEVRCFSYLLSPPALERYGFVTAVRMCIEGFSRLTGLPVHFVPRLDENLVASEIRSAAYRIMQEALSNVNHHAQATAATVYLVGSRDAVRLAVIDNGVGFPDPQKIVSRPGSLGLGTMKTRTEELDGTFEIRSGQRGTRVEATFPLRPVVGLRSPATIAQMRAC